MAASNAVYPGCAAGVNTRTLEKGQRVGFCQRAQFERVKRSAPGHLKPRRDGRGATAKDHVHVRRHRGNERATQPGVKQSYRFDVVENEDDVAEPGEPA